MDAYRFESVATRAFDDATQSGPVATYTPGEVIADRYKLTRELGRGGMGVVWAAQSLALGVEVAVKLIHSEVISSATVGRMMREAQAVARLSHPSLVRVFDFGLTNRNHPFLVMDLVQGETLRDQLERDGALSAIEAVKTLLPIADGLRMAHENGVVHRDLKPDNVFVAIDGLCRVQPKLLDFGVAKDASATSKLTQTGFVIGTPHYVSPEQAKGLDCVDQRSDVWSFCVMLYELLTGNLPFNEDNYNAQMFAIIERPPTRPPRGVGDARLWQIVLHGLAKDPLERFQTIAELGEVLAAWLYDHDVKVDVAGNSLRTVWLDNAVTRNSVSPLSKTSTFAKPSMGSGQSRIPPQRGSTLRGAGLVLAVAASVFGLFELTFANTPSVHALLETNDVARQAHAFGARPEAVRHESVEHPPILSPTPERKTGERHGAVSANDSKSAIPTSAHQSETKHEGRTRARAALSSRTKPGSNDSPPNAKVRSVPKPNQVKRNPPQKSKTTKGHDFGF